MSILDKLFRKWYIATLLIHIPFVVAAVEIPKVTPIPRPTGQAARKALEPELARWDSAQQSEAKECPESFDSTDPNKSEYDLTYRVALESATLFTVNTKLWKFCGSARPIVSNFVQTFDATTGKKYDPLKLYHIAIRGEPNNDWATVKPEVADMIRTSLLRARKMVNVEPSDCERILKKDQFGMLEENSIALSKEGMVIVYEQEPQGCYMPQPILLPYAKLRGYLDRTEAKRLSWKY